MPLSEHEQRLLEQIEQALYAEDPKFAHSWRSRDVRSLHRARLLQAAGMLVVGLGLLLAGVITLNGSTVVGLCLGIAGFLLMLGAAWYGVMNRQRVRGAVAPRRSRGRFPASFVERLEQRWERRQGG